MTGFHCDLIYTRRGTSVLNNGNDDNDDNDGSRQPQTTMENDDLEGLSQNQTEKVLQFQDLIGIDDITQCRDILTRHQWDLEVAIQEQLNLREGRPSMFASMDNREPQVINDRYLQRIFVNSRVPVPAHGFTGIIGFFFNYVFSICYNTMTSILSVIRDLLRGNERSKCSSFGNFCD